MGIEKKAKDEEQPKAPSCCNQISSEQHLLWAISSLYLRISNIVARTTRRIKIVETTT